MDELKYTEQEVRGIVQAIYSEFAELAINHQNHVALRHIIELEVEKRPVKPLKIFK